MVGLRYSTVIGAGQSWYNPFTHFLDLLSAGKPPELHEDGLQTRDYIFIRDVVLANLTVMKKHHPGTQYYNVVSGQPIALLDIANKLGEVYASKTGIDKQDKQAKQVKQVKQVKPTIDNTLIPGDVRHCHTSGERMDRDLGFAATTVLSQGLEELVDWYARKKHIAKAASAGPTS
jgi:nucleoside-diphosphate-sugar epimerase